MTTSTHRSEPVPRHDDPLAQAAVCAVCPKLCRPACPVARATGREAVAPWRISAAVARAEWTPESVTQVASCTGCGACGEPCLPGTNLPEESRAARASAASAGVPLPAAVVVRERIAATGSPRSRSAFGAAPPLLFGCAVQSAVPSVGRAALALFAAAGTPAVLSGVPERCCGAVAWDVGLAGEARSLAMAASFGETVVALAPSCARFVGEEWPRLGIAAPRVVTGAEWLATALADGRLPSYEGDEPVAWHPPCTLTRALGVVDAPLEALRALGFRPVVPDGVRPRCSGEGAAYRLVDAVGSSAVAAQARDELATVGAPVVTACPGAARRLGGRDLLEVAAYRLGL